MLLSGNPLVCDCEMRWYHRWYNDGWQVRGLNIFSDHPKYLTDRQDVDEDHIRDTDCTDPVDGREHNIAKVGHVSPIVTCAH